MSTALGGTVVTHSLYKRIRTDIERRILSGEWPPGHRIPFEHELMDEYDCSRMTVNKALSELASADLIDRRKRAGTYVRQPKMLSAVLEITDIRAEITAIGRAYRYQLLGRRRRKATRADAERLGVAHGSEILAISCLHYAGDAPFAHEDRLISLAVVPQAADADFAAEPPGTWLLAHVPWTEAEHRIGAIEADEALAASLAVMPGSAILMIERRTWRAANTLTAVRLAYPGPAHQLVARFQRR